MIAAGRVAGLEWHSTPCFCQSGLSDRRVLLNSLGNGLELSASLSVSLFENKGDEVTSRENDRYHILKQLLELC